MSERDINNIADAIKKVASGVVSVKNEDPASQNIWKAFL
jgi:hypothetical protein